MVDGGRQVLSLPGNYQHPLKSIIKASNFDILTQKTAPEEEPLPHGRKRRKINSQSESKAAEAAGLCEE